MCLIYSTKRHAEASYMYWILGNTNQIYLNESAEYDIVLLVK